MNKKKYTILTIVSVLSFILITAGVTYAFFSYIGEGSTENTVESGTISFIYEEVNKMGNGISITDAMPVSDSEGKASNNYFDFKVTSSTGTTIAIPYEITTRVVDGSDDLSDYVKLYLTKVNGTNEQQVALSIYSDLNDSTNTLAQPFGDKTLYNGEIPVGATNYTENYRLRMWLNNDSNDGSVLDYSPVYACSDSNYTNQTDCESNNGVWNPTSEYNNQGKTFSIKVNVYANGEQASQQKIESATTTDISGLKINNESAIENTDPTLNYDYYVETILEDDNEIELLTLNEGQTYTVENITEQEANTLRGVSTKQDLNLVLGDNYLKVTVTAANKTTTKIYIVKVKVRSAIARITVPNQELSNQITVTIDYHNNTNGMYKVGTNGTWESYTGPITLKSEEVYTLANEDKTITVYAKAFNESSQEEETSKVIRTLDLDMPNAPVITATANNPTLTKYGVTLESSLSVVYDNRNDITNYICTKSCNNSANWKVYTGNEKIESGEVQAKSVKNSTGLTALTTQAVEQPTNDIGASGYDGDMTTSTNILYGRTTATIKYMDVASDMKGQPIVIYTDGTSSGLVVISYDASGNRLNQKGFTNQEVVNYTIDANAVRMSLHTAGSTHKLYEIKVDTTPTFTNNFTFPVITGNGIVDGYNDVTIEYDETAVQKFYQIVSASNPYSESRWLPYTGQIRVNCGETVYAQSIDKNGLTSMQGTYLSDYDSYSVTSKAFDGDSTTYFSVLYGNTSQKLRYINVDSSAIGKKLTLTTDGMSSTLYLRAYNSNGDKIADNSYSKSVIEYTIPANTTKLSFHTGYSTHKLYEMEISD